MPLRARCGSQDLLAWEYSDEAWIALKKEYKGMGLTMPCCDRAAYPKTSPLGNKFFSHVRRGTCTTADESSEHMLSKTIIARAAQEAGWHVTTEHREMGPDGRSWIADVLCEKDGVRFAFEAQWSGQTYEDTRVRQKVYAASRVIGIWMFGIKSKRALRDIQNGFCGRLQVPAAGISVDKNSRAVTVLGFDMPLHDFVCNILHGLFTWEKPQNTGVSYWELIAAPKICTKCGHTTGDVSVVVHKDKHFKDLHIYPFGRPGYRQVANLIKKHLTPEMMLPHKLGQVTFRFNDPRPGEYHCNQCYHCDKVYHHIHNGEPTAITEPTRMSTISIYLELPFGVDTGNDSAAWYCNGKRMKF